tara:strand:+ start:366 stop:2129 length:1764 start_codon:yes stop_codon:yes gene_type:complete
MCGFNVNLNLSSSKISKNFFRKATKFIENRGPDKTTYYFDKKISIAFCKLSITDFTNKSDQPFFSQDKKSILVYNGMIYNYKDLKKKYFTKINFRTNSDTELLINLIYLKGIKKTLRIIKGMFSFVYINKKNNEIYCATDHLGQKPLFYTYQNNNLILSSNVRSVALIAKNNQPNIDMFNYYISSYGGSLPGKMTFFKNIFNVPGGHLIKFKNKKLSLNKYFSPENLISKNEYNKNKKKKPREKDYEFQHKLKEVVSNHYQTKVKKSLLLSGGSDSSLLAFLSKQNKQNIITASSSKKFEKIPFNTLPKIKKNLKLKTDKYKHRVEEFLPNLTKFIEMTGFAIPWTASVPLFILCGFAKKLKSRIVITGEGADEIMSGYYSNFNLLNKRGAYNIHHVLKLNKNSLNYKNKFHKHIKKIFFYKKYLYKKLKFIKNKKDLEYKVNNLVDIKFYLQKNALISSDSYSMNNSLELRAPYLYLDFVKFVLNLSKEDMILEKRRITKLIHKRVANKLIGNYFFEDKEGTRNFAKLIFDKNKWDLKNLNLKKIINIDCKAKDSWTICKLINLEILYNNIFLNKKTYLKKYFIFN